MLTSRDIRTAMVAANMTAAELSKRSGISNSTLSLILHDRVKISEKNMQKLEAVLPKVEQCTEDNEITWRSFTKNIPVRYAALALGKSEVYIREAIKQGLLPIGSAVKHGKKWSFHISPKLFAEYIGG